MYLRVVAAVVAAILTVGCSTVAGDAPAATAEITAELSSRAVASACALYCGGSDVYIRDHVLGATTLVGEEEPMSELMRSAIASDLEVVQFVSMDEADLLVGEDTLPDPDTVLVSVGPLVELGSGINAVDIGIATARDGYRYETYQFRWDGDSWEPVTVDDTGITITTSVS